MTTITIRQPTELSVSGVARTVRRVVASDRRRYWALGDFMQAVDPQGRRNAGTLRNLVMKALAIVTRQLGLEVIRDEDGRRFRYLWRERPIDDSVIPHIEAEPLPSQMERVIALLADNPRIWRTAEIAQRIFPGETHEQRKRHTSFSGDVTKAAKRLGWQMAVDPFDSRSRVYAPAA